MRRIRIAIIALIVMAVSCAVVCAESATSYSSAKALAYAEKHWADNDGTDCSAFARAVAEAGGIPRDSGYTSYSPEEYMNYLVDNGYAMKPQKLETTLMSFGWDYVDADLNTGIVSPGDIIVYKCTNPECPKPYWHMSIAAAPDESSYAGYIRYYAHNTAVGYKPLCKINCARCKADKSTTELYSLHITSPENGFGNYTGKVSPSTRLSAYNKIRVSWSGNGADSYRIFMASTKDGRYKKVAEATGTYKDITIPAADLGKNKWFYVRPVKNDDSTGFGYAGAKSVQVKGVTLKKSSVSSVKKASSSKVTVKFTNVANETGYQISKSTSSSKKTVVATIKSTSATSKQISAKKGKTYYYSVRAYKTVGGKKIYTPWSAAKKFKL